jgi:hypothetical protein
MKRTSGFKKKSGNSATRSKTAKGRVTLGIGPRTKQWVRIRNELKKRFAGVGITFCELCGSRFGLGFAHRKRRRNCDEAELHIAALLCTDCHHSVDAHGSDHMYNAVNEIIRNRSVQP